MNKNIDGIIEEYYYRFLEDIDCNDNDELADVYIYTKNKINEYISLNKEKFDDFIKETNTVKQNIANIILKDTWYHIYENICFLDTRYNIDQDIENINENKVANAIEKNDEIDIISLKDFLDIQCTDKNHRRRYKYSLCHESDEYHNDYNIPRTCSVYVDYYSANSELHQKRYL